MRISTRPLHNILRLDIQVNDTVRMDVRHGREELSRGSARTAELVTKRSRGPGLDLETPHTPEPAIQWRGCLLHNVSDPDLANSVQVLYTTETFQSPTSCGMGFRESLASPRTRTRAQHEQQNPSGTTAQGKQHMCLCSSSREQ